MSILITPGQTGDNPILWDVLEAIAVPTGTPGVTHRHPDVLIADKGHTHDSTRTLLRRRGIPHVIPQRADQIAHCKAKGSRGGRPPTFDQQVYKRRNVVERCFNRLEQWRDLATRYAKRARLYQASLTIAATMIWLQ